MGVMKKLDGDRLDSGWDGIGLSPCGVEVGQTSIKAAKDVEAGVWGPHVGKRRRNLCDGCRNCVSPDREAAFGYAAVPVALGKDKECWDFIRKGAQVWVVLVDCGAEGKPGGAPGGGGSVGSAGGQATGGRCRSKAEVMAELELGVGEIKSPHVLLRIRG